MTNTDRKYGGAESSSIACTWYSETLPADEKQFFELCERCPTIAEAWAQVEEAPMTKRLHLQWCAKTIAKKHKADHVRALQEVFPSCHVELCYKSILASVRYCSKSVTSVRGPWHYIRKSVSSATTQATKPGQGTDSLRVGTSEWFIKACEEQIEFIKRHDPIDYKMIKHFEACIQKRLENDKKKT